VRERIAIRHDLAVEHPERRAGELFWTNAREQSLPDLKARCPSARAGEAAYGPDGVRVFMCVPVFISFEDAERKGVHASIGEPGQARRPVPRDPPMTGGPAPPARTA